MEVANSRQLFRVTEAQLSQAVLEYLNDALLEKLRSINVEVCGSLIRGEYLDVVKARHLLLEAVVSENHKFQLVMPSKAPNDANHDMHKAASIASNNVGTNQEPNSRASRILVNKYLYEYVRKFGWNGGIGQQFNNLITIKDSRKLSVKDYLREVHWNVNQPGSEMVLQKYKEALDSLSKSTSLILLPIPITVINSVPEVKLDQIVQSAIASGVSNSAASAATQSSTSRLSFVKYDEGKVAVLVPNEAVESTEFMLRSLMRETIISNLAGKLEPIKVTQFTPRSQSGASPTRILVHTSSMLNLPVHVHVNALNGALHCSGGLAFALLNVSGVQLQSELNFIRNSRNCDVPEGEAVCTRSYGLPSEFVVHPVGPDGNYLTNATQFRNVLRKTYDSLLRTAVNLYPDSVQITVAMSLVSSGYFLGRHSLNDCIAPLRESLEEAHASGLLSRFSEIHIVNLNLTITQSVLSMLRSMNWTEKATKIQVISQSEQPSTFSLRSMSPADNLVVYTAKNAKDLYPTAYKNTTVQPLLEAALDTIRSD